MNKIRVAIVDDHKLLRDGIISCLNKYKDIQIAFEAADGDELIKKLKNNQVDVIILDIQMPTMDGIEALQIIRQENDKVRVIILTVHDEESYVFKLIDSKANGYLLKNTDPEEIYRAINSCVNVGFYFPDFVKEILLNKMVKVNKLNPLEVNQYIEFTERELKLMKMICEEKTTKEISNKLFVSERTVDGIRAKLIIRTGSKTTIGLVIYCYRNRLFK